jgi:transposase-like protein
VRKERVLFTEDFKKDAVDLAERVGLSQAGRDLGIDPGYIRRWGRQQKNISTNNDQLNKEELLKRNRELEKENGYLRKINDVLKKSTAIFSREHMSNMQ